MRRTIILFLALLLCATTGWRAEAADYSRPENWAYCESGDSSKPVDVFFVCPAVLFGNSDNHNMDFADMQARANFVGAVNMERGIYDADARFFAPYYGMAALSTYELPNAEGEKYLKLAYKDVRAAFLYYLMKYNDGRPFILAGFSQGADHVLRLMKEFFRDEELQDRLVAAYPIGWRVTVEELRAAPYLHFAEGERDTGVIVTFNTEEPSVAWSPIIPEGVRALAINPLNWRTDWKEADKSLNKGACFVDVSGNIIKEIPHLTGAYIDMKRGALKATNVSPEAYPSGLSIFPQGVFHIYDYQFFYRNLQENVAARIDAYLSEDAEEEPAAAPVVAYDFEEDEEEDAA